MVPTAIVLHGPTSSGKTSLAKALQATAPSPAFHISLDAFVTMSNRRDMRSEAEEREAYGIHCENLRAALRQVVDTKFDIIVDLVLRDPAEFEACLNVLGIRSTYVVGVQAPLEVLEERERSRSDRGVGMAREQAVHPAFQRSYDLVLDTSKCNSDEGAATIRRFIEEKSR